GTITLEGLNPLTEVVLLSRDIGGGQVEVQVSEQLTGWLLISELTNISAEINTLNLGSPVPTIRQATVIGTVRANLRRGPGSGFLVLQSLEPGTTVIAIGRNDSGGWLYVNASGIIGWMSASVLDVDGYEMLLPVIKPDGG
ncbi:MAG: SH3 domain-containing protein, partial [Anaerolineae bacterium]|nr:SH3 domain-containing protein [Anaerolineae bacterium]